MSAQTALDLERATRDSILDGMEADALRAHLLYRLRHHMTVVYRVREEKAPGHGYVCADDARRLLESWPEVPPPEVLSRNFMGSLFRTAEWVASGWTESSTPGSHGRQVRTWRLR